MDPHEIVMGSQPFSMNSESDGRISRRQMAYEISVFQAHKGDLSVVSPNANNAGRVQVGMLEPSIVPIPFPRQKPSRWVGNDFR